MARIGVFVCWCGSNVAETVDVRAVVEAASRFPGVACSCEYKYMCSDPGIRLIKKKIEEHKLSGVVVAACSPKMHEQTMRKAAQDAGLNPYLLEMANIREQCSWIHEDRIEATRKAIEIVRMAVEKVKRSTPLEPIKIPLTRRVLVVGGGIAGIQAALDLGNSGIEVILVEREPSIGGHMAQLSETFPTLDCSQCILTPRMVEVSQHRMIRLMTYSEVEEVSGYVGNFRVVIRQKARSVDHSRCNGCGLCMERCPVRVGNEFECGLTERRAIYVPFAQAVPGKPVIDRASCLYFKAGKCGVCAKICPTEAIDYQQTDKLVEAQVGAIIIATGYQLIPKDIYGEYGYGRIADVIDGLQFERMLSASGPTGGRLIRPSNGETPKKVVFVQCVGSRDDSKGVPYCSKICCMYTAKHAMLFKHKIKDGSAWIFYIDVRAAGKGYEEFVKRAVDKDRVVYLRGRVSRIFERNGNVVVKGVDTLSGEQIEIRADLVVLATGIAASSGAKELAKKIGVSTDEYGFFVEAHPKLRPVECLTPGVFLAGACQAPKDIPDAVSQASAAAGKAMTLLLGGELVREPYVARVAPSLCSGCFICEGVCPYGAIERKSFDDAELERKEVAFVNSGKCEGCGACLPVCRTKALDLVGFSDEQILSEVNVLTEMVKVSKQTEK